MHYRLFFGLLFSAGFCFSYNQDLLLAISDVLHGPLEGRWILAAIHPSAFNYFSEDDLMAPFKDFPIYLVNTGDSEESSSILANPVFQNRNISVVFITGKYPKWLNDGDQNWYFKTMIIINVNPKIKSVNILKAKLIQQSENILLMETMKHSISNQTHVAMYTSRPFLRSSKGKRRLKFFLGIWNISEFSSFHLLFPSRFPSFNGEVLQTASDYNDFPYVTDKDEGKISGVSISILKALGAVLNFTFTTTWQAEDGEWGEKINGSWKGLLRDVFDGRKNLTINYFAITHERWLDFDSSSPYFHEGFGFALRMPLPLPLWTNLIRPFPWSVWVSVLALVLLFPPCFFFIMKFISNARYKPSLQEVYFDTLKALLKQGLNPNSLPIKTVGRICLLFWWYTVLIISTSYSANLFAVLTLPVFPAKISSLEELAGSSMGLSMVDYGEFVPGALKKSNDSILRKLGDKMILVPWNSQDENEAYDKIIYDFLLPGKAAAVETYSFLLQTIRENDEAKKVSYFLKDQIYSGPLVFYFPKHTPWHSRFDKFLYRLVESGLIAKWYDDLMRKGPSSTETQTSSNSHQPLSLDHLQGPFLILLLGLGIATIFFFVEFSYPKTKKKK